MLLTPSSGRTLQAESIGHVARAKRHKPFGVLEISLLPPGVGVLSM